MIHLLTYGNFGLFDPKIEQAYRRRHMGRHLERDCECRRAAEDDDVPFGSERHIQTGHAWLRQLATDVEILARAAELSPHGRRKAASTVAANCKYYCSTRKSTRRSAVAYGL
jgi:hypothetical protein